MALPGIAPYDLPTESQLPAPRGPWQPQRDRLALLVHDMQRYFCQPYPDGAPLALLGVATIGVALAALALEGRDNGAVRFLAYATFAGEVLYLSYVTIDSILGTSAFFLLAGLVVAVLAGVVVKLEKVFARRAAENRP